MIELIESYYAYWMCFLLLTVGLYGMLFKENLLKKVIGLSIFQASIILFFIIVAFKDGSTVPIYDASFSERGPLGYINPLPHALMLTAIVVGVATVGVALALLLRIHKAFGTIDESTLWKDLRK
ncbi:MAG TPA: cation:proton antiporter subunit C [Oceanipulchritudo sp.]|nr:cation:proton antiporter subunit C [Oceanipulchritudo sp.]